MTESAEVNNKKVEDLQARVHLLARQKAHLALINRLLVGLTAASGLENLVPKILSLLMETIGGSNVALYHLREGLWHYDDILGEHREREELDDPLVAEAIRDTRMVRAVSDEPPVREAALRSQVWVFPLRAQERAVGAVRLEGMQITGHDIIEDLNPFLVYVSLMLDHEISNYGRLKSAHTVLLQKHRALEQEIAARKEAEERYRTIVEQSPDGIIIIDPEGLSIVEFNSAAHRQLGYSLEEFGRLTVRDLEAAGSGEVAARAARLLREGCDSLETRLYHKQGGEREVQIQLRRIEIAGRSLIHCMMHDLTDRKMMENELLRAQKLESVGLLAGGIAHDFNNLLTAIRGNISLAQYLSTPGERLHTLLENAERASQRAGDLTQQLLTFAKGGAPVKKPTSVGEVVRESAGFAVRGSNVRCEFSIPDNLCPCEVDPGQISQVINNLVINADQAMPAGGVIRIRCENVVVGADDALMLPQGRYVRISVADQGVGIPREFLPKVFDPYFTTKECGIGLGLATSYSILKRHGGMIGVESGPGEGTTFILHLPALPGCAPETRRDEAPVVGAGQRILVMDDEDLVLEVASAMLSSLGYRVTGVRDGRDAVQSYRLAALEGLPFAAVIMDLTVPGGMGGREAARELLDFDPQARVIVSSGYSNDPVMAQHGELGFAGVLVKPYRTEDLGRTLARVVAAGSPSGALGP